jgi:flavin-dependent dehydrogenase
MQTDGPAVILIRRIEFDHLLASLAIDAGAELLAPATIAQARQDADGVTLRTRDGRRLRAPMVVAADGVNSVIARRLGMNRAGRPRSWHST